MYFEKNKRSYTAEEIEWMKRKIKKGLPKKGDVAGEKAIEWEHAERFPDCVKREEGVLIRRMRKMSCSPWGSVPERMGRSNGRMVCNFTKTLSE